LCLKPNQSPLSSSPRSQHLARECSERGLQALLAAMQRGAAAGGGAEPGEGGVAGEEALLDDLLFFSDRAGDATMFDRWA
jgi:hypothetical protein